MVHEQRMLGPEHWSPRPWSAHVLFFSFFLECLSCGNSILRGFCWASPISFLMNSNIVIATAANNSDSPDSVSGGSRAQSQRSLPGLAQSSLLALPIGPTMSRGWLQTPNPLALAFISGVLGLKLRKFFFFPCSCLGPGFGICNILASGPWVLR